MMVSKGNTYSVRYNHYLPRMGEYTSKIVGGLDYRNSTLNLATLGVGVAAPHVAHPLSLAYGGTLTQATSVTDYTLSVVHNIAGGARGDNAYFKLVGAPGKADYTVLRFNGSVAGVLPQNWQYRAAWNTQFTRDMLMAPESLGLVGANAVRGFTEREYSSDKGYVINLEIYSPELAPKISMENGSLRLLAFVDRASGWTDSNIATVVRNSIGSIGVGFRLAYGKNISAKFDLARVTGISSYNGGVSRAGDMRGQLSVMANW
jgi:hemolysin activation/secretion protein